MITLRKLFHLFSEDCRIKVIPESISNDDEFEISTTVGDFPYRHRSLLDIPVKNLVPEVTYTMIGDKPFPLAAIRVELMGGRKLNGKPDERKAAGRVPPQE